MPTYEYKCEKCGHEFEREQRITEDPIKTCPECKSRQAKRLLSPSNFILKGGGWYADGYGSSGASKSEGAADKSSASTPAASTSSGSKKASSGDSSSSGKKSGGSGKSDKVGS